LHFIFDKMDIGLEGSMLSGAAIASAVMLILVFVALIYFIKERNDLEANGGVEAVFAKGDLRKWGLLGAFLYGIFALALFFLAYKSSPVNMMVAVALGVVGAFALYLAIRIGISAYEMTSATAAASASQAIALLQTTEDKLTMAFVITMFTTAFLFFVKYQALEVEKKALEAQKIADAVTAAEKARLNTNESFAQASSSIPPAKGGHINHFGLDDLRMKAIGI
jgi:hypothetical protein